MVTALCSTALLLALPSVEVPPPTAAVSPPTILSPKGNVARAPEGHVQLRWTQPGATADAPRRFELQQGRSARFLRPRTRYLGPDRACFVSGLAEGDAYFRVRVAREGAPPGPWSRTVMVKVRYVSRRLVVALMLLGAVLLLATVAVILVGHRRTRAAHRTAARDVAGAAPGERDA